MTLTEQQIADGWKPHKRGPCPVPLDSKPGVMFPSGRIHPAGDQTAADYAGKGWPWPLPDLWKWEGQSVNHIIAYREVQP